MTQYYKITNEEELHKGMQYKTGLNVDVLPFKPKGDCEPGGIYFTDVENILTFLNYGCWLRPVSLPEGEPVYENPGTPRKWKAHQVILGERREINLDTLKDLISQGANIHAGDDYLLRWASSRGELDMVKYLVERGANIHAREDEALNWALANRHQDVEEYLKSLL